MSYKVINPVAFFIYNKPDTTKKIFNEIRKVQPKKLYIYSDGPKGDNDKKGVQECREIASNINWECEVKLFFSETNKGAGYGMYLSINDFLSKESEGIIIEDDCYPNRSFFRFCDDMLEMYRENKDISMVSGYNFMQNLKIDESYYFSKYSNSWGWATWSDRWNNFYDFDLSNWEIEKKSNNYKDFFFDQIEEKKLTKILEEVSRGNVECWDYQWYFQNIINNRLSIVPKKNLIKNLGLGHKNATHTTQKHKYKAITKNKKNEISFPLKHPKKIVQNISLDKKEYEQKKLDKSFYSWVVYNLKKLVK